MTQPSVAADLIYSALGLDPDLADLVEMFVDEIPGKVATFYDCRARSDWESLRISVHQLKGAAGSYGFGQLTPKLQTLEMLLKQEIAVEAIQFALDEVAELCQRLRAGAPA